MRARQFKSQADIDRYVAKGYGQGPGRSEFRSHVTLARDAAPPKDFPFEPVALRADRVALIESMTQPDGVLYRVLALRCLDNQF